MQTITATVPVTLPPSWAAQQRLLLATMSDSISPFLDRYTHDDGELIYDDAWGGGADDFYEGYTNWPLLYLMGGKDHLVEESHRGWETVPRQLPRRGLDAIPERQRPERGACSRDIRRLSYHAD